MKTINKTEITIETHRILTLKKVGRHLPFWCEVCGKHVQMITANDAAIIACVSSRTIYQLAECRSLHFTETADRELLICLNSLRTLA